MFNPCSPCCKKKAAGTVSTPCCGNLLPAALFASFGNANLNEAGLGVTNACFDTVVVPLAWDPALQHYSGAAAGCGSTWAVLVNCVTGAFWGVSVTRNGFPLAATTVGTWSCDPFLLLAHMNGGSSAGTFDLTVTE